MVKGFFFLVLLGVLLSTSAAGQCGQRDVSGSWKIQLGKFKREIVLDLKQAGNEISGTAIRNSGIDLKFADITVKGTVNGDKVSLVIDNNDSSRVNVSLLETFDGVFGPDGTITGEASVFILSGTVEVPWTSDRPMKCLHKTVGSLGVKRSSPDDQTGVLKPPWIVAAPNNIVLAPFQGGTGITTLNWDAGKDHPYAEVWVKVDDQDERKIIELGKGTIQQPVIAGSTYLYILTDSGTTLATVTVRFRQ